MPYRIEFTVAAKNTLSDLPRKQQRQIISKIESLAEDPRPPKSRPLQGFPHLRRIQSGVYRIIYTIQDQTLVITVVKIGHRKDVYRHLT